jgi:taurine dioxygenase
MAWDLEPLSPLLGITIRHRDVRRPFSESERAYLHNLIARYHLLHFSDQRLDADDQIRFVELFGTVAQWGNGAYFTFVPDDGSELGFHSDFSFSRTPLPFISLYGLEADEKAAPTLFVDAIRACETMPARLRVALEGRDVLHISDVVNLNMRSSGRRSHAGAGTDGRIRGTYHPAIMDHPRTGVPVLFVNQYLSQSIDGISRQEGDTILSEVFAWLYSRGNIYEHRWETGDLLLFDNVALQHARARGGARRLRRVVVSEVPLADLFP